MKNKLNQLRICLRKPHASYHQVICDVIAGAWGKKFNAVSHKPKLTGTDWIELNWCARWLMGYGIKISFPRPPQWRHRSPGMQLRTPGWYIYLKILEAQERLRGLCYPWRMREPMKTNFFISSSIGDFGRLFLSIYTIEVLQLKVIA